MYAIRRATPTDAPGLVSVAEQTWHATYDGILPRSVQDQVLTQWYAVERIARQTTNEQAAFLVAVHEAAGVVGFAHLMWRQEPGDAELLRFYVLPEHQGHGLGRRLLKAGTEALARQQPVRRIFAQVEKENQIGRRAYEGLGFRLVREYEDSLFEHRTTQVELALELHS